jgi:sec-independent protein translocase protein TatA
MPISNIGLPELLFIALIVLLLFGAKRLPEIGSSFGKGIREFQRSFKDVDKAVREPERDREELPRPSASRGDIASKSDDQPRPEPKRLIG